MCKKLASPIGSKAKSDQSWGNLFKLNCIRKQYIQCSPLMNLCLTLLYFHRFVMNKSFWFVKPSDFLCQRTMDILCWLKIQTWIPNHLNLSIYNTWYYNVRVHISPFFSLWQEALMAYRWETGAAVCPWSMMSLSQSHKVTDWVCRPHFYCVLACGGLLRGLCVQTQCSLKGFCRMICFHIAQVSTFIKLNHIHANKEYAHFFSFALKYLFYIIYHLWKNN